MLITSGTLIPCGVLKNVGGMRNDFFIDHVDTEWCLRAISLGYDLAVAVKARMHHRMGDTRMAVWFFGWSYLNGYKPRRLYYRFRNFVYMLRLEHVPLWWKIRGGWYWLGNLYAHVVFSKGERLASLRAAFRGICHGLSGKLGPY